MALELAKHNSTYEDIASKFFEVRDQWSLERIGSLILGFTALHLYFGRNVLSGI